MTEKSIRFLGAEIHYYIQGSGNTIVLLHGFLENSSVFFSSADFWSKNHKVICIDLPGHGKSHKLSAQQSISEMADAVDAVVKNEAVHKFTIAGHSMGGYVALNYYRRYAEKCNSIILINTTADPDSEEKRADRLRGIKVLEKNPIIFYRESIPRLFAEFHRDNYQVEIDRLMEIAMHTSTEGAIACIHAMMNRPDSSEVLKNSAVPVLFIIGKYDLVISYDRSKELAALSKKIKASEFTESGHLSFIEEPDKFKKVIEEFLLETNAQINRLQN